MHLVPRTLSRLLCVLARPELDGTNGTAGANVVVHTAESSDGSLPPTFGDTVRKLDRDLFVGREGEIAIFRQWVQIDTRQPLLLNVSGPTGIGKSSLLRAFLRCASELGRPVRLIDGRAIPPTRTAFLEALGGSREEEVQRDLSQAGTILLLDSFELMVELSDYLRDEFLTGLEMGVKVAVAGRTPLDLSWTAASHWHRLIRSLPLDGLSNDESRAYLRMCGVQNPRQVREVLRETTGYPVLLSLAASLLELRDARPLGSAPEWHRIVHSVAEHLLSEIEDPRLRSLLTACAVIGPFDETTLTAPAGPGDGPDAFAQLCNVSLVTPTKTGLVVQHNLRRVLANNFKWRRPDAYKWLRKWAGTKSTLPLGLEPFLGLKAPSVGELPITRFERKAERELSKRANLVGLTPREREVLSVLGRGLTASRDIAADLVISQGTANLHVKHVLRKLGFASRADLAQWVSQNISPLNKEDIPPKRTLHPGVVATLNQRFARQSQSPPGRRRPSTD